MIWNVSFTILSLSVDPLHPQVCMREAVFLRPPPSKGPPPTEVARSLNVLPCSISFHRDDRVSLVHLIMEVSRYFLCVIVLLCSGSNVFHTDSWSLFLKLTLLLPCPSFINLHWSGWTSSTMILPRGGACPSTFVTCCNLGHNLLLLWLKHHSQTYSGMILGLLAIDWNRLGINSDPKNKHYGIPLVTLTQFEKEVLRSVLCSLPLR